MVIVTPVKLLYSYTALVSRNGAYQLEIWGVTKNIVIAVCRGVRNKQEIS